MLANATYLVHKAAFYIAGQSLVNLGIVLCIDFCIRRPGTIVGRVLNCRPMLWMGFPNAIRVTVGTPAENEKFLAALAQVNAPAGMSRRKSP